MLLLIILPILFVIFAARNIYQFDVNFLDRFFSTLMFLVLIVVVFAGSFAVGLLISNAFDRHWVKTEEIELVSLRNSDGLHGTFFLGCGAIGTEQFYFYYQKWGEGYKPGKVQVGNREFVYEQTRGNGILRVYTYQFVNPNHRWYAIDWPSQKHEFYIPVGSLKKNFSLE